MKLYIFLDVDGVLNHEPDTVDCGDALRRFAGDMPQGGFDLLCPKCVERVNVLCRESLGEGMYDNFEVILSSTWRRYFEPPVFTERIGRAGFDFHVVGRTAINDRTRGVQIADYLVGPRKLGEEFRYIVLDDDTYDMMVVEDNQVVTNYRTGFNEKALSEALSLIFKLR